MATAAQAEEGEVAAEQRNSKAVALRSKLQQQERELDRAVDGLVRVGDELKESQGRVDEAKARRKELGRRVRELDAVLDEQREASARSYSRLEDWLRFAYKGGEVEGILLLLAGFFGGNDAPSNPSATLQTARLVTESGRSIQNYKENKQNLRSTLRQVKATRAEYRKFGKESQALVEELEGSKSALRASVEGLGLRRDRLEERIAQLETEEEAGTLGRPPATGRGEEEKTRVREDIRSDGKNQDEGQRNRNDDGRDRHGGEEKERARELEIARDDIESRPVNPIPYEEYVRLYRESAERYGFGGDWYVLAAVGKIESNHGENVSPSGAGAMGPMQFLPSTWSSYGVDGDGDGGANIMDPKDAIPAAASYLRAGGAPDDWYAALFTYNRAGWYVEEVLAIAESYHRIHDDDTVGPYLEPTAPPPSEAPPRPEPDPRPEDASEGGEDPKDEPPSEDVPSPDRDPTPDDESSEAGEEKEDTVLEPESPTTADESTVEQDQY